MAHSEAVTLCLYFYHSTFSNTTDEHLRFKNNETYKNGDTPRKSAGR